MHQGSIALRFNDGIRNDQSSEPLSVVASPKRELKKQARSMVGNKYRRWTQEDDLRLLELRAVGRSAISISAALKRSTGAVHGRLSILRALAKSPKLLPEKENGPDLMPGLIRTQASNERLPTHANQPRAPGPPASK
jgi:hypothetical protein